MVGFSSKKIFVDREKWLSLKGDLGRAKAGLVRLDDHVVLFNKYNDRLEPQCGDL